MIYKGTYFTSKSQVYYLDIDIVTLIHHGSTQQFSNSINLSKIRKISYKRTAVWGTLILKVAQSVDDGTN